MAARTVTAAKEEKDHESEHNGKGDSAEDLYPARRRRCFVVNMLARALFTHAASLQDRLSSKRHGVSNKLWTVPRLWSETIASHRRDVRDAILEASARLVVEHGLPAVTMSRIAEAAGIGRATLYKYFPSLEAILLAWHERQIADHLEQLSEVSERGGGAVERLEAVLHAYALTVQETRGQHDGVLVAYLHRNEHLTEGRRVLHALIRDLVTEGVETGEIRNDVAANELAMYCLHAARAAGHLTSQRAVDRLVTLILSGLRRL